MFEYQTLTAADLDLLRVERLQALEADHARTLLLLAEEPPNSSDLFEKLGELERRILVHRRPVLDGPSGDESGPAGNLSTSDVPPSADLAVTNGHRSP